MRKRQDDHVVSVTPATVIREPGDSQHLSGSLAYAILVYGCSDLDLRHLGVDERWVADMPHDGSVRADVSELRASGAGAADTGSPPSVEVDAATVRVLTFAGAALAAVYAPDAGNDELRLLETAGCAASEFA